MWPVYKKIMSVKSEKMRFPNRYRESLGYKIIELKVVQCSQSKLLSVIDINVFHVLIGFSSTGEDVGL